MAPHICKGVLIRFCRMVVNQEFEHAKEYLNCNALCDERGGPSMSGDALSAPVPRYVCVRDSSFLLIAGLFTMCQIQVPDQQITQARKVTHGS